MLKKLTLEHFKNFKKAELELGSFSLLIGTNASGKSNIRDAFRFLHGISRGYTLAEIIGEKWAEGGVLQWRGIRGGTRETVFHGESNFTLGIDFQTSENGKNLEGKYLIEVDVGENGRPPRINSEELSYSKEGLIFRTPRKTNQSGKKNPSTIIATCKSGNLNPANNFSIYKPIVSQCQELSDVPQMTRHYAGLALKEIESMRFFDLRPEAMRIPSVPGQNILGDLGENLSSVIQSICEEPARKKALIHWLQELTPMDAKDLEFPADQTGKILLALTEENGTRISAHSASDGTLRFLALLGAFLGVQVPRFFFFEEMENGIHSSRIHLLMQLIESQVADKKRQLVGTTHSPYLLSLLSPSALENVSVVYRLKNKSHSEIKRLLDIPHAGKVFQDNDLGNLHGSGWFENVLSFLDSAGAGQ